MRLTFVWPMPRAEPTTIVIAAITHTKGRQSQISGESALSNTRRNAPNAATFVPALMNAVTHVGAPWYASGVHMWKGTAATLNANPTPRSPAPARASDNGPIWPESLPAIAVMLVVPVAP